MHHQIHTIGSTKRKSFFTRENFLHGRVVHTMKNNMPHINRDKMDGLRIFRSAHNPYIDFQIHDAVIFLLFFLFLMCMKFNRISFQISRHRKKEIQFFSRTKKKKKNIHTFIYKHIDEVYSGVCLMCKNEKSVRL